MSTKHASSLAIRAFVCAGFICISAAPAAAVNPTFGAAYNVSKDNITATYVRSLGLYTRPEKGTPSSR